MKMEWKITQAVIRSTLFYLANCKEVVALQDKSNYIIYTQMMQRLSIYPLDIGGLQMTKREFIFLYRADTLRICI